VYSDTDITRRISRKNPLFVVAFFLLSISLDVFWKTEQIPVPGGPTMKRHWALAWNPHKAGFTLVEVMFALVILVGTLIMAGTALSSAYEGLNVQAQRHAAMRHCQATLGLIRAERSQVTRDVFRTERLPAWVSANGAQDRVLTPEAALPDEKILVALEMPGGPTAVTVTATWTGLNRRPLQIRLSTLMLDE